MRLRVDDAVEEVDREERAEEHDLRPDEEEDPDDRRADPRAVVDRRRMLVRVAVPMCRARPARRARSRRSPSETTWSMGSPVSVRRRSIRSRRSQPERACGNVETMISSTRSSWVASIVAVYGSGWTTCPCASIPSSAAARARAGDAGRIGALGGAVDCGATIRKLAGPCAPPSRMRSRSSFEMTVSFATTRTFFSCSASSPAITCCDGTAPAALRDVLDDVAAHPAGTLLGVGRDDDLVRRGSSCVSASFAACTGSCRRRTPAPDARAAKERRVSSRAGGRPRRGACRRRRRSRGAAR